jgi:hypothetical protein
VACVPLHVRMMSHSLADACLLESAYANIGSKGISSNRSQTNCCPFWYAWISDFTMGTPNGPLFVFFGSDHPIFEPNWDGNGLGKTCSKCFA